jgi:hypothetical protein
MNPSMPARLLALLALVASVAAHAQTAPKPLACPKEVPAGSQCFTSEDPLGGFYWMALPAGWNKDSGVLVVHAHGGPADTGPAKFERGEEDLKRWAITVRAGYAWVGHTYRRGGFGVTMAAEDTERARQYFVQHFGPAAAHAAARPELWRRCGVQGRRAVRHGGRARRQGARPLRRRAADQWRAGRRAPGPMTSAWTCARCTSTSAKTIPRPTSRNTRCGRGLPMDSKLTRAELAARVDECTGVRKPAAQRTDAQKSQPGHHRQRHPHRGAFADRPPELGHLAVSRRDAAAPGQPQTRSAMPTWCTRARPMTRR